MRSSDFGNDVRFQVGDIVSHVCNDPGCEYRGDIGKIVETVALGSRREIPGNYSVRVQWLDGTRGSISKYAITKVTDEEILAMAAVAFL